MTGRLFHVAKKVRWLGSRALVVVPALGHPASDAPNSASPARSAETVADRRDDEYLTTGTVLTTCPMPTIHTCSTCGVWWSGRHECAVQDSPITSYGETAEEMGDRIARRLRKRPTGHSGGDAR